MGLVLFIVFWAFQAGYFNSLGATAWFLGAIIFAVLLFVIVKIVMPKPPQEMQQIWMFAIILAVISTFVASYLGPYLNAVIPADPSALTPILLSWWLVIFGSVMFATGWTSKNNSALIIGLIWLLGSVHFGWTGPNSWLHFAFLVGLPYVAWGLVAKK